MSALGRKADILQCETHVRFTPKSGHSSARQSERRQGSRTPMAGPMLVINGGPKNV